jgi:hypothetical protein
VVPSVTLDGLTIPDVVRGGSCGVDRPVSLWVSPVPIPRPSSCLLTERIVATPEPSNGKPAQSIEKQSAQFAGGGAANNMIIANRRKPAPMKEYRSPFSLSCSFSGSCLITACERKLMSAPHARQNCALSIVGFGFSRCRSEFPCGGCGSWQQSRPGSSL